MNYLGSAPARESDISENEISISLAARKERESGKESLIYLKLLWERRRFLSRAILCALLGSTLAAFLIPSKYDSTTRLMPPDNQPNSGLAMAAAAMAGSVGGLGGMASDLLGLKSTSDVFVGILGSRTVEDSLIQQFDLKKVYSDRKMEDARKDLAAHTAVSVDRKSQIIAVTVTDHDPKRAAAMAQAYVEQLNRLVAELSTSSAHRERLFLEERLRAVNEDLENAERDFSQFASKNTAIDIKEQGKAMVEAAGALQGELIAAQSEYEGLSQIYTANNIRVRSARARIDELRHQLEKLGGKGENGLRDSEGQETGEQQDSLYPSIRKLPLLGVRYADLFRRTKVQEAVFETLTKEYELAKVQEVKEIATVKVLDPADIPDKKSFPPRVLIIILGTILGLTGAIGWIFGSAMWQESDPSDPRRVFAEEVFSTVSLRILTLSKNGSSKHAAEKVLELENTAER